MKIVYMVENRHDLAKMLAGIGVEVGVADGDFAAEMLANPNVLLLHGVDPYTPHIGYTDYTRGTTFNNMRRHARDQLTPFSGRHAFIFQYSMEAVKDFADNSLDFVYIDADHHYKTVKEDIEEWAKKVKPGGKVCGDDFIKEVQTAVEEYCEANNKVLHVLEGSLPKQWLFTK